MEKKIFLILMMGAIAGNFRVWLSNIRSQHISLEKGGYIFIGISRATIKCVMNFTITMKPVKALLVLLLSLLFQPVFPQKKHINFEYLQTRGLSQNSIYCMLKDHYGFMWFGTQAGLNKFDGYKFTVYTHTINDPKSIAANEIANLCEDKEGNLWIATKNGGLSQYDAGNESFINYQEKSTDPASLSSNQTNKVYEDRLGNIWVGTLSGLNLFNKKTKNFFIIKLIPMTV